MPCDKQSSCKPKSELENRVDVTAPSESDALLNFPEISGSPESSTANSVEKAKCDDTERLTEDIQQLSPQLSAYLPTFFDSTTDLTEDSISNTDQPRENTPGGIPDRLCSAELTQDEAHPL